jgi:DNA modification methylase
MYSILVWEKPLTIINKNRFSQNLEYIMRIYDYGTALNKSPINKLYNRVKRYNPPPTKEHLTQKPLSLIKEFLILSKKEGMLVYDPFAGSGTTLIACWEMNIDCIGTEINKEVYEVAHNRVDGCKRQQKLFSYDGNE